MKTLFQDMAQIYQQKALDTLDEYDIAHAKRYRMGAERIAELEQQLAKAHEKIANDHYAPEGWVEGYKLERSEENKRAAYNRINQLEQQNLSLLDVMGHVKSTLLAGLRYFPSEKEPQIRQAIFDIEASADLLAERDKKRDAALICSIRFPTMLRKMWSGSEMQKFLNDRAEARLDGSWVPELGDK